MKHLVWVLLVGGLLSLMVPLSNAAITLNNPPGVNVNFLYISIATNTTVLGASFHKDDVIKIDVATGIASMFFQGSAHFTDAEDIDALALTSDGKIILSTDSAAHLPGIVGNFARGDLVLYDPVADSASMFFQGSSKVGNINIDAAATLANGHILFSTAAAFTQDAVTYDATDIVEYNSLAAPGSQFSSYFDGSDHGLGTTDIDALSFLPNGDFVFSLNTGLPALSAANEDLLIYHKTSDGTIALYLDSSLLAANNPGGIAFDGNINALDIDATYTDPSHQDGDHTAIPEPGVVMGLLMGVGSGLGIWWRRRP